MTVSAHTALRHAARGAREGGNVCLYSRGSELVLVLGAHELSGRIHGQVHSMRVASAGLARAVVARYSADLTTFGDRSPQDVLAASVLYAESAWRWARRRAGRRS